MHDKLPPHAIESEMAIIGCCITTPVVSMPEAQAIIRNSEFFYDLRCRMVWDMIIDMDIRSINLITVLESLKVAGKENQIGGHVFLGECQDKVPSPLMLPSWLEIVSDKYLMRRMIQSCHGLLGKIYEHNGRATELLDEVEAEILSIRPQQIEDGRVGSLMSGAIDKIEAKSNSDGTVTGLSTGLYELDRLTDGLHKGEMITLCAKPSRGKTALAVGIAIQNALRGVPAVIFSAEMMPVQLVVRAICSESRVNFKNVSANDVQQMLPVATRISKAPLHIIKASGYSIGQIKAVARRLKQKHDIQLIVIDYLQIISAPGDSPEQVVKTIANGIKLLALELEIPVIALSQVNDMGEAKYARAITEVTDSTWKLENEGEWQHDIQPINLIVEKCRDGETGKVELTFLKTITRFETKAHMSDEEVSETRRVRVAH